MGLHCGPQQALLNCFAMDYEGRQDKLRSTLEGNAFDALLVTHLPNVRYLCGFTGSAGALFISRTGTTFFSDGRYKEQARTEVQQARIMIGGKAPMALAGEWLKAHAKNMRITKLGIESQHVSVAEHRQFRKILPSTIRVREAPGLVEAARMVKDADEIALLRAAIQMGEGLLPVATKTIRPGVKETEVAAEMEYAARREGAEGMSFDTIIASGPRSALPHGRASTALIPSKGFVVCDFGIIRAGYCSDMTRTLHVGTLSRDARHMYNAVREAQQAAIDQTAPGVKIGDVDLAARRVLKKSGLGKYFTHSTGHGVGLEIHEMPRIAAGNDELLQPGMVITIEPGAYIPGTGGVRIEDMVLVTERSCEVLTTADKELIVV